MNKLNSEYAPQRKLRDILLLCFAILFSPLYVPHLLIYWGGRIFRKKYFLYLDEDIKTNLSALDVTLCPFIGLIFLLHNNSYFRSLFYYRIGYILSLLISWYRPGNRYFTISKTSKIKGGLKLVHPYSTIINADSIGKNFSINCCTTIGSKNGKNDRAKIGDNVHLGTSVVIIGDVRIGNNVIVGAGSVVVKDVPDNCVVAGNPAKIIRFL